MSQAPAGRQRRCVRAVSVAPLGLSRSQRGFPQGLRPGLHTAAPSGAGKCIGPSSEHSLQDDVLGSRQNRRADVPAPFDTLARCGTKAYHEVMDYRRILTIEPGKRGGKPCIRGMRITVYDVLDYLYLASGMTPEQILEDFPDLTAEDIRACLAFAADRERRLMSIPA
jgi:uncharacterized protein (DUF433 family)